jgi:IS1 family transposase
VNCGNPKTGRFRLQYCRRGIGSQSNGNQAGSGRGFDFRSEAEEEVSRDQKTRCRQQALAVYPVSQEPVQQSREVVFALLCPFHVVLCERDQNSFFSLWLAACTFSLSAVLSLRHLKKYIRFMLTAHDFIYILSSSQDKNMDNRRLSKEKQVFLLAALCEGTPIRAIARMLRTEKYVITRIIRETGAAFADYMNTEFRDLRCSRIEMDEQWQYVGCHAGRMPKPTAVWEKRDKTRGDFWLWACIDADTKLVISHKVGKRNYWTGYDFVKDVRDRVAGPVQIATDNLPSYPSLIRGAFGYEGFSYGTETKIFAEPELLDGTLARLGKNEGVRKMVTAERKAVVGSPNLESLTTSHIERLFLSVRQELKRFQRKGLGYSKDLETHKLAIALHLGVYNFVRKHTTLGTTPAVAAGVELEPWGLERVVEMTANYMRRKEDRKFEEAFAKAGI